MAQPRTVAKGRFDMSFLSSKRFRGAWMISLVAGALFPFIDSALNKSTDVSYLASVNHEYLQKTLSFAAVFFIIQCAWAFVLFRRDLKTGQDRPS